MSAFATAQCRDRPKASPPTGRAAADVEDAGRKRSVIDGVEARQKWEDPLLKSSKTLAPKSVKSI
jgi:hypothetical protein